MVQRAGQSRVRTAAQEKSPRKLPEGKKVSQQSIVTATDLEQSLGKLNVRLPDEGELAEELLEDEEREVSPEYGDLPFDEMPDGFGYEDDIREFDEPDDALPELDLADDEGSGCPYLVSIEFRDGEPRGILRQAPRVETFDPVLSAAIRERCDRMLDRAAGIARAQRRFFEGEQDVKELVNYSQSDLLEELNQRWQGKRREDREHLSRVLDALWFRVPRWGELPARFFLRQYSRKSGLTASEKENRARHYLQETLHLGKRTIQQKAEGFVAWLRDSGYQVELTPGKTEADTYKTWRNLISRVERGET